MTKQDAVFEKFSSLKRIVAARPESVAYFARKESISREMIQQLGPKKQLVNGIHKELSVWIRDLLTDGEKVLARSEFERIDKLTEA